MIDHWPGLVLVAMALGCLVMAWWRGEIGGLLREPEYSQEEIDGARELLESPGPPEPDVVE